MQISYDPAKRTWTLEERGIDFADAPRLFTSRSITLADDRHEYGERRMLTYGWLEGRAVAMAWTDRDGICRVISMRHMHRKEIEHVGLD